MGNEKQQSEKELCPAWKEAIRSADILLLQREIDDEVNAVAAEFAQECGVKVILDLAGSSAPVSPALLRACNIVSPARTELSRLLKQGTTAEPGEAELLVQEVMREYPNLDVLLKHGPAGTSFFERDEDYMDNCMNA